MKTKAKMAILVPNPAGGFAVLVDYYEASKVVPLTTVAQRATEH
jgi:hypothetical protein